MPLDTELCGTAHNVCCMLCSRVRISFEYALQSLRYCRMGKACVLFKTKLSGPRPLVWLLEQDDYRPCSEKQLPEYRTKRLTCMEYKCYQDNLVLLPSSRPSWDTSAESAQNTTARCAADLADGMSTVSVRRRYTSVFGSCVAKEFQ
jgi:hypothetical protein